MRLPPGTRVKRTDTGELGVVQRGGSELRRLIRFDGGGTEYIHSDYLVSSTEPVPDDQLGIDYSSEPITVPSDATESDLEAASETPDDDSPIIDADADPAPSDRVDPRQPTPDVQPGRGERWGRDGIIRAIQRWAMRHGEPPSSADWERSNPGYPRKATVQNHFGGWANAIEAAGFDRPTKATRKNKPAAPAAPAPAGTAPAPAGAVPRPSVAEFLLSLDRQEVEAELELLRWQVAVLEAVHANLGGTTP